MMGFGFIWMLVFWGGVIALAIWLIGLLFPPVIEPPDGHNDRSPSAQEILKARYASGEITQEEYQQLRQMTKDKIFF